VAKNNQLIKMAALIDRKSKEITTEVYAGIALALHRRYGWGYKRINDLFAESQIIWQECVDSEVDMIKMCEEETGIEVLRRTTERME
jgi:hypothetical protein